MAKRQVFPLILLLLLLLAGACGDTDTTTGDTEPSSDTLESSTTSIVDEQVSDAPEGLATAETGDESGEPDETVSEVIDDAVSCEAPELQPHFVDVALDDPDGGLNVRAGAGVDNEVLVTVPRSGELITTGGCAPLGSVDWWEVTTSDGSLTGWVSSRFLSDLPVFNPGLGNAIDDPDNVGLSGETVEEILAQIADSYGFDEDVVFSEVDVVGIDAQGVEATYDLTGLKDDASNGYRVVLNLAIERSADGNEVTGYRTLGVTNFALCTRGVSDDGLCL